MVVMPPKNYTPEVLHNEEKTELWEVVKLHLNWSLFVSLHLNFQASKLFSTFTGKTWFASCFLRWTSPLRIQVFPPEPKNRIDGTRNIPVSRSVIPEYRGSHPGFKTDIQIWILRATNKKRWEKKPINLSHPFKQKGDKYRAQITSKKWWESKGTFPLKK